MPPPFPSPTIPFWAHLHQLPEAPPLPADATCDVCVVGAGIAGLTTALLLAREGAKVIVLDSARPGSGESSRTTAHLSNAIDDRFYNISRWHGREGARLAAQSHAAAIDRIQSFVEELDIPCDFRRVDGYLFAADDHDPSRLDDELEAAQNAGLRDVSLVPWPIDGGGPRCLRFPQQAQMSPWPYLAALADEFIGLGGRLHGDTRVHDIMEGRSPVARTETGLRVAAKSLVVATNTPINDRFAIHTKQAPYRTYVVSLLVPHDAMPLGLYWDNGDPYHYVRLAPSRVPGMCALIVGGEDHKTGQDEKPDPRLDRLEHWARLRFPVLAESPSERWSGQVMETIDGLGYLGRNPGAHDNIFVATGDSGMGMTHGTLAGMIITDLVANRANPWSHLYNPGRMTLAASLSYTSENFNVARQYLDWGRPHAKDAVDDLPPGSGRVVQRGAHKVAIYRDAEGSLHERSAVCPHLGCIVSWNDTEKSWDCPCHGSRFLADGSVVNGPSAESLAPAAHTAPATTPTRSPLLPGTPT
jgi:glycine/D-amino acid oxidase-like deaminating enzyme/nitrite reductase/ring-hydroxylating ferredoxin subunit